MAYFAPTCVPQQTCEDVYENRYETVRTEQIRPNVCSEQATTYVQQEQVEKISSSTYEQGKKHHRKERLGEIGALAAGAFAMYEAHKAKNDPENCRRHQAEAGVAGLAAVGSGGYAIYEHRKHKKFENQLC